MPTDYFGRTGMRYQGRITNWKDDQGYGFITPNGGGEPVSSTSRLFPGARPIGDEIVTYELQHGRSRRLRASAVNSSAAPGEASPATRQPTASGTGRAGLPF
jgi:cold shock CspA family protein